MFGKTLGLVFVSLLLAGCTGTIYQKNTNHRLMHSLYDYGVAYKHLLVQPVGRMFGSDEAATARRLIAALPAPVFKAPTTYTLDATEAEHPTYRLILGLNSPLGRGSNTACKGGLSGGDVAPGGPITILAVFCKDQSPLSYARGGRKTVTGWDDPALSTLLSNMITATFPREREIDRCSAAANC